MSGAVEKQVGRLNPSKEALAWMARDNLRYPVAGLVDVPERDWPQVRVMPIAVKRNRYFLIQIFAPVHGGTRLSIQRCAFDRRIGHWKDGITWDELQQLKDWAGFAEQAAIEIYPPTRNIVDVANLRHLWVLESPPPFMWGTAATHPQSPACGGMGER